MGHGFVFFSVTKSWALNKHGIMELKKLSAKLTHNDNI